MSTMTQSDEKKSAQLNTTNQLLDEKYGKHGAIAREAFNEKTLAWYYGEIVRDRRKALKRTQKQLAEKVGKEQSTSPVPWESSLPLRL